MSCFLFVVFFGGGIVIGEELIGSSPTPMGGVIFWEIATFFCCFVWMFAVGRCGGVHVFHE